MGYSKSKPVTAVTAAEAESGHAARAMLMTVLICGTPGSGSQIIGLFANRADAQSYAKDHGLKERVAEVISPPAFAESQVATASKAHL
jgi:hypothetical protein